MAVATCLLASTASVDSRALAAQTPDQDAAKAILDGSREVVRTAPTMADRFEMDHVIVYVDKGLMPIGDARAFAATIERYFVAASRYLRRRFDKSSRQVAKPSYFLTDRAGISHAEATRVFLRAQRVIPSPAIAIHESVHLLLMKNPDAPRNRTDLGPEEDARLTAITGVWLAEGFAGFAGGELAAMLRIEPDRLFVKGDRTTVDAEAREWLRDPRGARVVPFIGSQGMPDGLLADRANVAAPFYVLGQSFIKHLVTRAGLAAITRLYEEHFNGMRSIEEDVKNTTGRDLVHWREEWLRVLAAAR